MRMLRFFVAVCLLTGASVAPATVRAQETAPAPVALRGMYQGVLKPTPAISLTLTFTVTGTPDKPGATLDVVEQGVKGFPVTTTTFSGNTVTFALDKIGATFVGKRTPDGKTIAGTFTQGGNPFPLTLTQTDKPLVLDRPQTPKPPFPYRTVEVLYPNPEAPGVILAGTLTLPPGEKPFAVALFITGSGAQDRDETVFAHKPFAVMADDLARRGIASLRVDDRGVGGSKGDFAGATTTDFAGDVRAGIAFLKTRREIDGKRIGLIGHSEGGVIAPMVAASDAGVAFIVLLAGTGVPGDQVMLAQQKAIVAAMGDGADTLAQNQKYSKGAITAIKSAKDAADAREKVKVFLAGEVQAFPKARRPAALRQLEASFLPWCTPWFLQFVSLDPQTALASVQCPVLAINGSLDLQVLPKQNLPAIAAALKKAGNTDVAVRELPGLNHLLQTATAGSPAEYSVITQTVAPEALALIGDWIAAHTAARP